MTPQEMYQELIARVAKLDADAAAYMRDKAPKLMSFSGNHPWFCGGLGSAFVWSETPQGHEFWMILDGRLRNNEDAPIPVSVEPSGRSETDPHGRAPNEAGAKLDAGKNRLGLVLFGFSRALQAVGEVGTYGANKYTDNGWMEVPDGERRYTDALLRHLLKEATGEVLDPDTEVHHAAHVAWNALARLDLILRRSSVPSTGIKVSITPKRGSAVTPAVFGRVE